MDNLELSQPLLSDIITYMDVKKMPYNTRRQYGYTLKKIWDSHSILDKSTLRQLLLKFKHQNQRAVLILINKYCYENNIDYKMILPKLTRIKPKNINVLPIEEIDIMITSAPHPYNLALKCIFRIGAGLRVSEVIKLSWYHFKWSLWIKNKEEIGWVEIKHSKGDPRVITVPVKLMEELYEYAKERRVLNEFGIPVGGQLFEFGRNYKPQLRANNLDRWRDEYMKSAYDWFRHNIIKIHCEKALGHKVKVHQLRHSRATQLYNENDVPIEIIQKQLGHSDINTTMVYTKVGDKKVFDAMKGID